MICSVVQCSVVYSVSLGATCSSMLQHIAKISDEMHPAGNSLQPLDLIWHNLRKKNNVQTDLLRRAKISIRDGPAWPDPSAPPSLALKNRNQPGSRFGKGWSHKKTNCVRIGRATLIKRDISTKVIQFHNCCRKVEKRHPKLTSIDIVQNRNLQHIITCACQRHVRPPAWVLPRSASALRCPSCFGSRTCPVQSLAAIPSGNAR